MTRPLADLRLASRSGWWPRSPLMQEAAVALVLRGATTAEAEVLLVRRALRAGDPWSGHMALPGGRRAPADRDLVATALRETREEIGVSLARAALIGALPPVFTLAPARARLPVLGLAPRVLPMVVRPFVFCATAELVCTPNGEVSRVRWAALSELRRPERATTRPWRFLGVRWPAPAWDLEGDVVWGLTHQMLRALLRATG
jgi:8-oxo-dGTP pyrophosphatase MutT (NUDIX family)